MSSPEVSSAIKAIETAPAADKPSRYNSLLQTVLKTSNSSNLAANLIAFASSLLGDPLGIVASRPLLAAFVEQFRKVEDADVKVEVGQQVLDLLAPKVVSYEEQDTQIKEILADAYEAQEDYRGSAKILQTITLDSSQRAVSNDDKAKIWVRIVRCYLEEEDPTSAFTYLNRVKNVIHSVQDKETRLMFQLSQARIHDSQRAFLDASQAYYTISLETVIAEEERLHGLSSAIVCAVLAPAGPQRARTLAKLYKDERAHQVEEFSILEKMFLDRLLSPAEVKAFSEKLQPHHLAKMSDGSTVLDKAVLEHNLLGASKLYNNIGIDQLGELLGVDADRAEDYAAKMLEQGRLAGYIDQIDRLIFFEGEGSGERKTGHAERIVGKELRKWDANVQGLAEEVERVTTMIQNQYPEFYATQMVH
ncbi:COP9 signalosome-like protein complex subunit 4 [Lindgomyces ingoldianus]|uniref:COP9 signalosome-like protein complex subunit 4 n=1 Tax=Lindgomyces ingoldianus TaxID=673940 RepID=A0ACB6QPT8_9PLEO|nr:COP9 signalosome-like protein complex subunit 4 [Lindgomyces ingoldianus]KAF2468125.1 COP9 signalosome-like protein complex subunit 4 [Lindgomyces ingoldianus]